MTVERGVVTYHNENNIWGFDHVWVKVVWVVGGGMQEESNGLRTQCGGWLRHMTMKGYTKINKDNFKLKKIYMKWHWSSGYSGMVPWQHLINSQRTIIIVRNYPFCLWPDTSRASDLNACRELGRLRKANITLSGEIRIQIECPMLR